MRLKDSGQLKFLSKLIDRFAEAVDRQNIEFNLKKPGAYKGRCFESGYDFMVLHKEETLEKGGKLCHGWVFDPNLKEYVVHCWNELGNTVWDYTQQVEAIQKAAYYRSGQIIEEFVRRYSFNEMTKKVEKEGTIGMWDKECFPKSTMPVIIIDGITASITGRKK